MVIYHIALRPDWEAAKAAGEYRVSTKGVTLEQEGFIHCSLRHQVGQTLAAFYTDTDDVVLLAIDPERLTAPVKHEAPAPGAEEFPHIYGPVPVNAVVNVTVPAR